ncbi:pseudouridine synthase [Marinilactibacillus psychrotolerans]|uniref:Pseudouridine synthase n=1 Tax=Marinilactibacillus psychrotolerans 42ea TaxID=1255609 RepID=A0A1R4IFS7_9LACT|nr:pseudouridine synthase [Marinilactibacillus psychrotolerans]SJN18626.1 Ribosomal small subunit pseudouridine synthase A [Marinilactibacillus psychrotolerans 42ea]
MRIDKLLAHSGLGTRKEVKKLLKTSIVEINGETVKDPKTQVNPDVDEVLIAGESLDYQEYVYFILNKPAGVISATEDDMHETVLDLLQPSDIVQEPHPVGRLDIDTEGLLLLTNDGALTHRLLSPKHHVDKKYFAEIKGIVTEKDITKFKEGVELDDEYLTMPAELTIIDIDTEEETSKIEIVIQEGKFHQVKRMFHAVDKEVLYLKRLSMGSLSLDPLLELGAYRECTKEEVQRLKA